MENLTIEQVFAPQGKGNNPNAGKRDLHYKIKEWGFVFPTEEDAKKYADEHEVSKGGFITRKKNVEDN